MQFHIDQDAGSHISGWLAPENPSVIPSILVTADSRQTVELQANVLRTDLKDLGLHRSGMAGFLVDQTIIPRLSEISDVEIRDSETQVLIHRRFKPEQHLQKKLFQWWLPIMPQFHLENLFFQNFALGYDAIQRHSFDTTFSIINNRGANSIYASGRPIWDRVHSLLRDRDFTIVTMLRDPYEELAERLLFIRYALTQDRLKRDSKYLIGLGDLVEVAKKIDFNSDSSLFEIFDSLGPEQQLAISNPFVRALTCAPGETPNEAHVSLALHNLARMDLVGVREHFTEFKSILEELLGCNILGEAEIREISWVKTIAQQLAKIDVLSELLALDQALYDYVLRAVDGIAPGTAKDEK